MISIDWKTAGSLFINGDCMEYMKTMPDKCVDLASVDPPYGISWMKQVGKPNKGKNWKKWESKKWDEKIPNKEYFRELFRVSENQIIWGGNYFDLPPTPCLVIWDKMQEFSVLHLKPLGHRFQAPVKLLMI